jgi:hypothetical protein
MLLRNLHAWRCLADGSNELRCPQRKNVGTAVSCSLVVQVLLYYCMYVSLLYLMLYDLWNVLLFGLANLTKLSVGCAGTNPSTTLYIRIRGFYTTYQIQIQIKKFVEEEVKWSRELHFLTIIIINEAWIKINSDHLLNSWWLNSMS